MRTLYEKLLDISQSMLDDCEKNQWNALAEKEQQRQVIIQTVKNKAINSDELTINTFKKMVHINQRILALANASKQDSLQSLVNLKRNAKHTSQYDNK
jgi:hypothetical protein